MCLYVCVAVISLGSNRIGDQGAAAIGAGLQGVPSLTSLQYVTVMQAWVMCMMGRGQAEWCDGECVEVGVVWCGAACECVCVSGVRGRRCGAWRRGWCGW